MSEKLPKVAVCVPSFDMVHKGFAMALARMCTFDCARLALLDHRTSLIHKGRNALVDEALRLDCEWLLFLDSDLTFPAFTLGRLLSHNKPIVGASYLRRSPPHELLVMALPGSGKQTVSAGLHEVAMVPTGCLLVRAAVFRKMARPWFEAPLVRSADQLPEALHEYIAPQLLPAVIGEDTWFCAQARAAGFKVWLDVELTQDIGHIGERIYTVPTHETEEAAQAAPANERNAV